MLEGAGFHVIDLGVQVAPEKVIEGIQEHKPDIVGFSAFLTTTMPMFKANIKAMEKAGFAGSGDHHGRRRAGDAGVRRRRRGRRLCGGGVDRRPQGQGTARRPPRRRHGARRCRRSTRTPGPHASGSQLRGGVARHPRASVRVPPGSRSSTPPVERNRDRLHVRRSRHVQKCKVRVLDGAVPASELDLRAFDPERARRRLAARLHAPTAEHDIRRDVPPLVTRPKAATVGVGRQVILRPAVQKRYVELDEPTLTDQRSDAQRLRDALDDLELRTDLARDAQAHHGAPRRRLGRSPR